MSWDIFIQDLPAGITSTDEIPADFVPGSLGTRSALIAKITAAVPEVDFTDPEYGRIEGPDCWIEVHMPGTDDNIEYIALSISGGESAVPIVADVLDHLQLRGMNGGSPGNFFSRDHSLASFREWAAFRDRVIALPAEPNNSPNTRKPGRWLRKWGSHQR